MSEPNAFASLSPSLLARKGAARPAMRPQLQPIRQFHEATARDMAADYAHEPGNDLGWNDMGDDATEPFSSDAAYIKGANDSAEVVSFDGRARPTPAKPEVVAQREALARSVSQQQPAKRRKAIAEGRRAAFTLRLDAERHLKLRLASTVTNESAQQLVTDALDALLENMPEVAALATRVRERAK